MRSMGTTTIAAAVAMPFLLGFAAPSGCGGGAGAGSQATNQGAGSMPSDSPPSTVPVLGAFDAWARLGGYQETPAISTTGHGTFKAHAAADGSSLDFELTWDGLKGGEASAAHLHLGRRGVPGGVVVPLCGAGGKPACPTQPADLTGTLTSADVTALAAQGVAAGDLAAVLRAIRAGAIYVNVHSPTFAAGEIRGQLRPGEMEGDDDHGGD